MFSNALARRRARRRLPERVVLPAESRRAALPDEPRRRCGDAGLSRTACTCRALSTRVHRPAGDDRPVRGVVARMGEPPPALVAVRRRCWRRRRRSCGSTSGSYGPMLDARHVAADGGWRGHPHGVRVRRSCSVALAHYSFGRRRGRVGASILALTAAASLVLPLLARGTGRAVAAGLAPLDLDARPRAGRPRGRVVVMIAARRRVARLHLDRGARGEASRTSGRSSTSGAAMHLATLRPTQPDPVWTTVATGKLPWQDGRPVGGAVPRALPPTTPASCCPTAASRTGSFTSAFSTRCPHTSSVAARAADLEHPRVRGADRPAS